MNVENLTKLYEVGQKILRERLPIGFGEWDCGTFACLSGWYGRECELHPADAAIEYASIFGISDTDGDQLFNLASDVHGVKQHPADVPGPAAYAELERRMEYLADLIVKAGGTVPDSTPKRVGIPACVREIFETEAA